MAATERGLADPLPCRVRTSALPGSLRCHQAWEWGHPRRDDPPGVSCVVPVSRAGALMGPVLHHLFEDVRVKTASEQSHLSPSSATGGRLPADQDNETKRPSEARSAGLPTTAPPLNVRGSLGIRHRNPKPRPSLSIQVVSSGLSCSLDLHPNFIFSMKASLSTLMPRPAHFWHPPPLPPP